MKLSASELGFVVLTRALGGVGLGLLLGGELDRKPRRMLGFGLLAFAAITTVPIALTVLQRRLEMHDPDATDARRGET